MAISPVSHPSKLEYESLIFQTINPDYLSESLFVDSKKNNQELFDQLTKFNYSAQTIAVFENCLGQLKDGSPKECKQDAGVIPLSKDWLINMALISLTKENYSLYFELMNNAKEMDPNWIGWIY